MDKKKQVIISAIGVITLTILVIGATYAYFQSTSSDASITDVNITSHTVDTLTFEGGDKLSLEITQDNFATGNGNLMSETTSSVTLTANSKTKSATEYYNLYFYIGLNEFSYTKDSDTPEVILQVYNNEVEVTDISTLDYKSVIDGSGDTISGYDITTKSGIIALYKDKEITASPSKTDNYIFKVIFVNHGFDQSSNAGKRFIADIVITQEELNFTLGDVNNDTVISGPDVNKINLIIKGTITPTLNERFASDVTLDGIIDEIDVKAINFIMIPYIPSAIYNITYDLNGGVTKSKLQNRYTPDFDYTIFYYTSNKPNITKDGYEFLGWTCDNLDGYETPQEDIWIDEGTTGDLHFVANWELNTSE